MSSGDRCFLRIENPYNRMWLIEEIRHIGGRGGRSDRGDRFYRDDA